MITTDEARIAALASHASYGDSLSELGLLDAGYELVELSDDISLDDPITGFHAQVWRKTGTGELLVAFTGTQDGQDAVADLALGTEQWRKNKAKLFAALDALDGITQITFTGQSLGGALGQYAAYDYVKEHSEHPAVTLLTFNSLGGRDGLAQLHDGAVDDTIAGQIDAGHFVAASAGLGTDFVARLGGGFLGGATYQVDLAPGLGWVDIHTGEAFWAAMKQLSVPATPADLPYVDISFAQKIAGFIAYVGDDGVMGNLEGGFRFAGSVMLAAAGAPTAELDALSNALQPGADAVGWGLLLEAQPLGRLEFALAGIMLIGAGEAVEKGGQFLDATSTAALLAAQSAQAIANAAYELAVQTGSALAAVLENNRNEARVYTGQIVRTYQASHPGLVVPSNPTVFDLAVDPAGLRPDLAAGLGRDGLLLAGGAYRASMAKAYVDQGGWVHTVFSAGVSDFTRPGNHTLAQTGDLLNGLRAQADAFRLTQRPLGGALTVKVGQAGFDPARSEVLTLISGYDGSPLQARVFYAPDGTPLGIQALETLTLSWPDGAVAIEGGDYYTFDAVEGDAASVAFYGRPKENAAAPVVFIRAAAEDDSYTDPLMLDGDGDGVRLSASAVPFDLDADGVPEPLPWSAPTDPLLVLDVNRDGRIANGAELLDLTDVDAPLNLLALDDNNDGVLDSQDAAYHALELWQDRNQDGYASLAERQGLAAAGIVSIDVDPAQFVTGTAAGQANIKGVLATYADGTTRTVWDLPLSSAGSTSASTSTYAPGINKVTASGQVALVASSPLDTVIGLAGSGAAQAVGHAGDDTLLGTEADEWLIGGAGGDRFQGGAGRDLLVIDADDRQEDLDAGADVDTLLVADDRGVLLNLAQAKVEVAYGGYGNDVLLGGGADNYFITGAAGDDLIVGGSADDALSGEDGADFIDGDQGDDLIRGHRGDDWLDGNAGNDVLDGGPGDDAVRGGEGQDVIVASGGQDDVDGGAGTDLIELRGELADYRVRRNADGSYTLTDTRNHDGSAAPTWELSDRDGVQHVTNVERFSFMRGATPTAADFGMAAPLPVDDRIGFDDGQSQIVIPVSQLLGNDLDFQSASADLDGSALAVYWVGDALGGTVGLSADKKTIIFTPNAGDNGPLEFAYKVQDGQGNQAPVVTNSADPTITGELKGRVLLVPSDAPTDPDYARQWYLGAIGAPQVWNDYTGAGVQVLVLEPSGPFAVEAQAADLNHPDLRANRSADFADTRAHSAHATAVAGTIAAGRNGVGGVGVAYGASIDSIGMAPDATHWISTYRSAIETMRRYDVVNNSWLHDNPWGRMDQASGFALQHEIDMNAIAQAATQGRAGLGTVMVFGAGNDRAKGHDAGLSTLTANPYTIAVGAINRVGDVGAGLSVNMPFSNRGANVLVSAPGSNILTSSVQLENASGSVFGAVTTETQGTSLAAPIVSGVAALLLEANPALSYRDVQTILALTAHKEFGPGTQTDTTWYSNHDSDWNGAGMHYSHDLGFGMVDARAAVRLAEAWTSEGVALRTTGASSAAGAIPDLGRQTLSFDITGAVVAEQVMVSLQVDHPRWSDLKVTLISPAGTRSVLLDRPGVQSGVAYLVNPLDDLHFSKDLMSVHFRGESSAGTWQLVVEDVAAGQAGSGSILASLDIVGSGGESLKRYVLTDEYAGGWNITDVPASPSELNAAAVSGDLRIDLSGATASSVAGKALTVGPGIDRLLGGDGQDALLGGTGNEAMLGGRGNDALEGGAGHDRLDGGLGDDSLKGGAGQDVLVANLGTDSLWGGPDADVFLIDGDTSGTTHVKDFAVGPGGDTLQIRTRNRVGWGSVAQTVEGSNLRVTYNTAGGPRSVVLEGVTAVLGPKQLRTLGAGEEVSVDPVTGGYAGGKVVSVAPQWELQPVMPQLTGRFFIDTYTPTDAGFIPASVPGLKIVHVSERSASAAPGQQIAIVVGPLIQEDARLGFGRFLVLPQDVLSAKWAGVDNTGSEIAYLVRDTYSNGGQISYDIVGMHWTQGSDESETLVAGPIPVKPDQVGPAEWDWVIRNLGPREYHALGGDDELIGDSTGETMDAGAGDDILTGAGGNDNLTGGIGADRFVFSAGAGQDRITDLEDIDTLRFEGIAPASVVRTTRFRSDSKAGFVADTTLAYGPDTLSFTSPLITPDQLALNDVMLYDAAFDGSSQRLVLDGKTITTADDVIVQEHYGATTINTLAGDDLIFSLTYNGLAVDAGDGQDVVYVLEGGNTLGGGAGDDRIEVTPAALSVPADTLIGGAGNDRLTAGDHGARLYGDDPGGTLSGNDTLWGGVGDDTLYGGLGADTLLGRDGVDTLYGEAGKDALQGGGGGDVLFGGGEDDVLSGSEGNDRLDGGDGADVLTGGAGNDALYGGAGGDTLIGDEGDDVLTGGAGDDLLETGSGADSIELDLSSGNDRADALTGVDTVVIHGVAHDGALKFELLDNGAQVKLSWGAGNANSLTLSAYSFSTTFQFDGATATLRQIFERRGYWPDSSFDYVGAFDIQLQGDVNLVDTVVGGPGDDQLYGGPATASDPAYWYVVGRDGDDSLAAGLSGAFLDGGAGADKFLGSNGVAILRDTFHGGRDTMVMPAGITPEMLRFYRIPNPLDAALLKDAWDGTYVSSAPLGIEAKVPDDQLPGGSPEPRFDTLRIQSMDGKTTVDIVGYFGDGVLKNDIVSVVFPTAFDAQGNSIVRSLDDLAGVNVKGGEYSRGLASNVLYPYYFVDSWYPDYYSGSGIPGLSYLPFEDDRLIVGGETGTVLEGRVKVNMSYNYHESGGAQSSAHGVVRNSEYEAYRSSYSSRDLAVISGQQSLFNIWSNGISISSFQVAAIALPDWILGFAGNDTIRAGGAYVELHASGVGSALSGATPFKRYYGNTLYDDRGVIFNWAVMADEVNGGAGDDTYVYRAGDGNLNIIALGDRYAGADGFDTLELSDFAPNQVSISGWGDGGALYISVPFVVPTGIWNYATTSTSTATIQVAGGALGSYQVDQIRFRDGTVINTEAFLSNPKQYVAADSRFYLATTLATAPADAAIVRSDDYASLAEGVMPLEGTPLADMMMVPDNGVVFGREGTDQYIIDLASVSFAVIGMDRGDIAVLSAAGTTLQDCLTAYCLGPFAGAQTPAQTYLGKNEAEWLASGVMPQAIPYTWNSMELWTTGDAINLTLQLGSLRREGGFGSAGYSLDDWQPVDESNDRSSDLLLHWQMQTGRGWEDHHVVLLGVTDAWGSSLFYPGFMSGLSAEYGTQGDDYIAAFPVDLYGHEDGYREIYTLGGDDTVDAYATDSFDPNTHTYSGYRDIVHGGSGDDVLDGGAGDDRLYGASGNDSLMGGLDNDYLDGGLGRDILVGGAGDDVYVIDADDAVIEESGSQPYLAPEWMEGAVTEITSAAAASLPTTPPLLADDGLGTYSWAVQVIESGSYRYFKHTAHIVYGETLSVPSGTDEVRAGLDVDLNAPAFANIENITLLGTAAHCATGDSGANRLAGNGAGSTLAGGTGDDVYILNGETDVIIESASAGQDRVETSADILRLPDNLEELFSVGIGLRLYGNALANHITGDEGNNIINGGAGGDILEGRAGEDVYYVDHVGDTVIETASGGTDIVLTTLDYVLTDGVEELRSVAQFGVCLTGNGLGNRIVGGAGDDMLDGAAGCDRMYGGAGDDSYVVDDAGDLVVENAGEGMDTVLASVTYTLASHVENLTLTAAAALNATGNELSNILAGNSGANVLTGLGGDDRLDGKGGADTLIGGAGNDSYLFGHGYGADAIVENDATAGNTDVVQFLAGIAADQIWFRQIGNDLEAGVIGTSDTLTIENWYSGPAFRVELFKAADGRTLLDDNVDALVGAMAGFAPPAAGQTTLPTSYQDALQPVIAAQWQ